MLTRRLPPLFASVILLFSIAATAQTRGGGSRGGSTGGSYVNPATNARNAAVLGTGDNLESVVHPNSVNDEPRVEFRSQTVLIQVPVVITDKSGNHLHGLSKEDFTLLENGKPVNLANFEELTANSAPLAPPAATAGHFQNLTLAGPQPRNIVVVALDTVNTPFLDQAYGRKELIKFLANNVQPGQVLALMLITSQGLKVVQGLTGDPQRLIAALKRASGEISQLETVGTDAQADAATGDMPVTTFSPYSDPLSAIDSFVEYGDAVEAEFRQANAIETTMNAFLGISFSLSGVHGRKSLIWATGGFPFNMNSPETVPGGYLSQLYERTMLALNEAEVSVYPVDIRGLVNNSPFAEGNNRRVVTGLNASRQITNRVWLNQSKFDTLNDFADMTGGRAFYNTNDLAGSFRRAADDASSYYMLGYYLDTHNNKPGWRKLEVKLDKKKNVEVRARTGFFVTNATMNPLLSRNSDMTNALHSPIEGTGVPVTVQWLGITANAAGGDKAADNAGNKRKASFLAHMPAGSLSFDPAGRDQLNFDFAALAYDKNGKEAGQAALTFTRPVPADQLASVRANGLDFRNALQLAPGQYTVRFVVRDNVTGKVGSVTAPLTVN
jgi:VWFA-related protein